MKKILQIKKGEYLLEIRNNSVATTYHTEYALDISNWSLEQLGNIVGNLKNVGYTKAKVILIDGESPDLKGIIAENGIKIGESMKSVSEKLGIDKVNTNE